MIEHGGSASRGRAAEKLAMFLTFMIRHEVTDRLVVSSLIGLQKSATWDFIAKLVRAGLVAEMQVNKLPTMLIHLTPKGLQLARSRLVEGCDLNDLSVHTAASRISVKDPVHTLLVQHAEVSLTSSFPQSFARSEREINQLNLAPATSLVGKKVPDALLWIPSPDGSRLSFAIEVQESLESPLKREQVLSVYGHLIGGDLIWGVYYLSTNPNIIQAYRKQLLDGPRPFHRDHLATSSTGKKIYEYAPVHPGMADLPVTSAMIEQARFRFLQLNPELKQQYTRSRRPRKAQPVVERNPLMVEENTLRRVAPFTSPEPWPALLHG